MKKFIIVVVLSIVTINTHGSDKDEGNELEEVLNKKNTMLSVKLSECHAYYQLAYAASDIEGYNSKRLESFSTAVIFLSHSMTFEDAKEAVTLTTEIYSLDMQSMLKSDLSNYKLLDETYGKNCDFLLEATRI